MGLLDSMSVSYVLFTVGHFLCFVLALAVCGLYGSDLSGSSDNVPADSRWVYGVVVGAISAVTCVIYAVPLVLRMAGILKAAWDFILFILWIALFGVFGRMYIHKDTGGHADVRRMKNAVWVDLVSALLWLGVAVASLGYWWKNKDRRTRFTGRARV